MNPPTVPEPTHMQSIDAIPKLNHASLHPAYIFWGPHETVVDKTISFLQKHFCPHAGCGTCTTCAQIRQQQHHAVIWLAPEKHYTLDDLEIIFQTIIFALGPDEHVFFVLQKADFLSTICANKLLKSMEEPPAGYHFILLAQRHEAILPTIRSRCMSVQYASDMPADEHAQLYALFTNAHAGDPVAFLKIIDQAGMSERDSIELLDRLLKYWLKQQSNHLATQTPSDSASTKRIVAILQHAALMPPMPGSSKLFWKNLFLQIKQ